MKTKAIQYSDSMRENDQLPEGVNIVYWEEHDADLPTISTEDGDYIFYTESEVVGKL